MGRGGEVSFNALKCFYAFVKIFFCGKFNTFKTNKAVLTIVIGLKNICVQSVQFSSVTQ